MLVPVAVLAAMPILVPVLPVIMPVPMAISAAMAALASALTLMSMAVMFSSAFLCRGPIPARPVLIDLFQQRQQIFLLALRQTSKHFHMPSAALPGRLDRKSVV